MPQMKELYLLLILERQEPGRGGEIQLTTPYSGFSGDQAIFGCLFDGIRHDSGDKMGFLKATVDLAPKREEFHGEFRRFLQERVASNC
jgi:UTP--glucose-1-phosphate uridylyltransferase